MSRLLPFSLIVLPDDASRTIMKPVDAYLSIDEYIRIALENGVEAIHPGYGLLSG